MGLSLEGIDFEKGAFLLVDKPIKFTSFDVVGKIRGAIKNKLKIKEIKVGHGGTLDPLATGLMIICTGKFTKQLDSFLGLGKAYTGTFRLGETTPSYDGESQVDATYPYEHINPELLDTTIQKFLGDTMQVPPIFSAIKKDGKRAYESARAGETLVLEPRKIHISDFKLTRTELPELDFYVACTKGTYIRALAADFGKALGSGAWLSALRRVSIGTEFKIENAWNLDELLAAIKIM